jgi:16S rRNA (cytidine1402-2'-O)-methyltransferase
VAGYDAGSVDVPTDADTLAALVDDQERTGVRRKDAILDVARRAGLPKRVVYDAVHKSPDKPPPGSQIHHRRQGPGDE